MRWCAFFCALLVFGLGLPGCARFSRKRKPVAVVAPRAYLVGTVTLVNEEGKFVLVDNAALPVPPAGGVLKCYQGSSTEASAELVATDVRQRPFTIADIREGTPRKGDRVLYLPPEVLRVAKPAGPEVGTPGKVLP